MDPTEDVAHGYGLPEVFRALRSDLDEAEQQLREQSSGPLMTLSSVEVEIQFTIERETAGKAGLNLKVLGVGFEGGGGTSSSELTTHRLLVRLDPIRPTGLLGGERDL